MNEINMSVEDWKFVLVILAAAIVCLGMFLGWVMHLEDHAAAKKKEDYRRQESTRGENHD